MDVTIFFVLQSNFLLCNERDVTAVKYGASKIISLYTRDSLKRTLANSEDQDEKQQKLHFITL